MLAKQGHVCGVEFAGNDVWLVLLSSALKDVDIIFIFVRWIVSS
jgi:hypothetical protein